MTTKARKPIKDLVVNGTVYAGIRKDNQFVFVETFVNSTDRPITMRRLSEWYLKAAYWFDDEIRRVADLESKGE